MNPESQTGSQNRIKTVTPAEREQAIATMVAAFSTDPVARWANPDSDLYYKYFPHLVEAFCGAAFEQGTAFATESGLGVALWLAPGAHPDEEEMGRIMQFSVPQSLQQEVLTFASLQSAKHPAEPHWYLPLIGVEPAGQGMGIGSALMAHALQICDDQGLPAYLEATSEDSLRLYERHGFETVGAIQFGSSPTMWPMRREPRT